MVIVNGWMEVKNERDQDNLRDHVGVEYELGTVEGHKTVLHFVVVPRSMWCPTYYILTGNLHHKLDGLGTPCAISHPLVVPLPFGELFEQAALLCEISQSFRVALLLILQQLAQRH